ncbi:MAG: cytochrome c peroxidase [bacterium]
MHLMSRASVLKAKAFQALLAVSLVVTACDSATPTNVLSAPTPQGASRNAVSDPALLAVAGARIFSDKTLSLKQNQSCASCHDMDFGFTSPNTTINANGAVMFGSVTSRFGSRKPPSVAYATQSPVLYYDPNDDTYVGGNFWDGRATGTRLGSPSAEQSQLPFVNPVEQGLPDVACVVWRISKASYVNTYVQAYDARIKSIVWPNGIGGKCETEGSTVPLSPATRSIVNLEFDRIALAIAAFEASPQVNAFSSKYDASLKGTAKLTDLEETGRILYEGQAGCAGCHPNVGEGALMTDYTYDNIGVPANPKNPALLSNAAFRDLGLGGVLGDVDRFGQEKVPTLRNLDKRLNGGAKSYMHNGAFKTLEQVVHFYNTRDVLPDCAVTPNASFGVNCWPAPEVTENVNRDELGNLGLTVKQEAAVVAYLKTLNDGFFVPKANGGH